MEEHALNGEYISVLRNGVLSYGDVPVLPPIGTNGWAMDDRWLTVSSWGAHTALVGRNSTAAGGRPAPPCCARYWT